MTDRDRLADVIYASFKKIMGDKRTYSNPEPWKLIADEVLAEEDSSSSSSSSSSSYELCHSEEPDWRRTKIKINYEAKEIVITY